MYGSSTTAILLTRRGRGGVDRQAIEGHAMAVRSWRAGPGDRAIGSFVAGTMADDRPGGTGAWLVDLAVQFGPWATSR